MNHSSRNTPCPICQRNTDDKCRWSDEFILCYDGDSFAPPRHLRVGDRIKVNAETFALCSTLSGFAGSSHCFALVDDFNYRFLKYEDKRAYRIQCVRVMKEFLQRKKSIDSSVEFIELNDNLQAFKINELSNCKLIAEKCKLQAEALLAYASANKRYIVKYISYVNAIFEVEKIAIDALAEISSFEEVCLGCAQVLTK
ncbi:MAG: hypothetical protein ACO3LE_06810 [Bdellovibrionota bacterium]